MRTSTIVSTILSLALFSSEVLATPPACLLACVSQVSNKSSQCSTLSNVHCMCSNENNAIKSCLDAICPNGNADAAYSAFKKACSDQNVSVGDSSSSSALSSSSSASSASSSSAASSSSSSAVSSSSSSAAPSSTKETTSSAAPSSTSSTAHTTTEESTSSSSKVTSVSKSSSTTKSAAASSTSSVNTISTISKGAANLLEAGSSFAIAAIVALLI